MNVRSRAVALAHSLQALAKRKPYLALLLVIVYLALLTMLLRAVNLTAAYDVFLDEVTYLYLSESVADGLGVRLHGQTFYLHPPAFFYLEAAFLDMIRPVGDLVQRVYEVRALNVALAGVTSLLLLLNGRSAYGLAAGALAALIYALDPLSIRLGSRNMLEVASMVWVLAGLLVILPLATGSEDRRVRPWRVAVAGALFGLGILTKDMMVFLTLLPLAICFVLNRCLPRRVAFYTGATAVLLYAIYPLGVLLSGDFNRFLDKKGRGIERLVGLVQDTGFNRGGGPNLLDALLDRLVQFGPTYLIFAIGGLALVLVWKRSNDRGRLVSIWTASAYALLLYLIPIGTLETQFFYYLLPLAVLSTSIAVVILLQHRPVPTLPAWLGPVALTLVVVVLMWSAGLWWRSSITPDNGYERVLAFVESRIPADKEVASTSETGQFLLDERADGPWGNWFELVTLAEFEPDYLIVSQRQLEWDFGDRALPLLNWLEDHGRPVFSFAGPSNGQLVIYFLPPASWQTLPAVTQREGKVRLQADG